MSGVILLMTSPIDRPVSLRRGPLLTLAALLAALFVSGGAGAAEQTAKSFNLSADTAAKALRRFTEQSGIPVLFGTETAAQVRTNAVQGEFTPDEAMARLLANTGLVVTANEKTGALTVSRDPNAQRAAPVAADSRPSAPSGANVRDVAGDAAITLSPFVVNSDHDTSWTAATTLVGSRTNQELAKVPITVDAITGDFMRDLGVYSVEDAASFVAGLTVVPRFEARTDDSRISYRGLGSTNTTSRNFFLWYVPADTYNVERFDFNKGSNSLMFGDSAPGGQATIYTKRPRSYNFNEVFASYGANDSYRFQLDFNRRLSSKLDLRFNAVDRADKTYVHGNYQHQRAVDLAIAFRPFKSTAISLEAERGKFVRRRADNAVAIRDVAAPGRAFASIRWYYTSDGEIAQYATTAAINRTDAGGNVVSLLEGQTRTVRLPNGTSKSFSGFEKSFNILGVGDYLDRPYNVVTASVAQSFGKLAIEVSYNQQVQEENRNDVSFGTASSPPTISVDANGRPFLDEDGGSILKIFNNTVKAGRLSAAYPFEFGGWMKQFLVLTANRQKDTSYRRLFSIANAAAPGSLANNIVRVRAYLDTPEVSTAGFWDRLLLSHLPTTSTFQPVMYEVFTNTGPSGINVRYSSSQSASLSGEYFGGRLNSLLGVNYNQLSRKIPVPSVYIPDARGNYTFPGKPEDAPASYTYDPNYDLSARGIVAGLTYALVRREHLHLNVYGVYSQSFNWQAAQTYDGQMLGPILGDTFEVGLKGDAFNRKVFFTVAVYQIERQNTAYLWTPDLLSLTQLEDLFNPNNRLPSDPSYFSAVNGLNQQRRTVNSQEQSRGFDLTLQGQRVHGLQARVTFSHSHVEATRDFGVFKTMLDAAIARTSAALAPGGNPAMAENATYLANAQSILSSNVSITTITGLRSAPYTGSGVLDYQFPRPTDLRVGLSAVWVPDYNVALLNGVTYRGASSLPLGLYAMLERKLMGYQTVMRLGVQNVYDVANGSSRFRKTGATSLNSATSQPNYIYRYVDPTAVTFSTTVKF